MNVHPQVMSYRYHVGGNGGGGGVGNTTHNNSYSGQLNLMTFDFY